jgi:hypothetical protein
VYSESGGKVQGAKGALLNVLGDLASSPAGQKLPKQLTSYIVLLCNHLKALYSTSGWQKTLAHQNDIV